MGMIPRESLTLCKKHPRWPRPPGVCAGLFKKEFYGVLVPLDIVLGTMCGGDIAVGRIGNGGACLGGGCHLYIGAVVHQHDEHRLLRCGGLAVHVHGHIVTDAEAAGLVGGSAVGSLAQLETKYIT